MICDVKEVWYVCRMWSLYEVFEDGILFVYSIMGLDIVMKIYVQFFGFMREVLLYVLYLVDQLFLELGILWYGNGVKVCVLYFWGDGEVKGLIVVFNFLIDMGVWVSLSKF